MSCVIVKRLAPCQPPHKALIVPLYIIISVGVIHITQGGGGGLGGKKINTQKKKEKKKKRRKRIGPDDAVAKLSTNGLVGIGFAS